MNVVIYKILVFIENILTNDTIYFQNIELLLNINNDN